MKTLIDCLKLLFKEDDENPLSSEEMRVYITLLKEWNKQTRPEWFEFCLISKAEPKAKSKVIPKSTLIRIRERLHKRGLIQYVSGNGKVQNPVFKICSDTKCDTKNNTKCDTNSKEKVSPIPPLKENITELREKEKTTKVASKKEADLSFCLPSFAPIMQEWLDYKQKRKESYKTDASIRKCYHNLATLSDNNPTIAQMIVDQSIANNWAGLFKLKNNGAITNQNCGGNHINSGAVQDQPINIYKEVFGYDGAPENFEEWFNKHPYGS